MNRFYFNNKLVDVNNHELRPHIVQNVFSPSECEKIITLHKKTEEKEMSSFRWGQNLSESRKTEIYWLHPSESTLWIFERACRVVSDINKRYYRFDLGGKVNAFQLGKYSKGHGYDWHPDHGKGLESRRKISISIQLSDKDDYEGGDLEFYYNVKDIHGPISELGSMILFPSWLVHRVNKVVRGTRWSLVNWVEGPPFR